MPDTKTQTTPKSAETNGAATNGAKSAPVTFEASFLTAPLVTATNNTVKALAQPRNKRSAAQIALDGVTPQIHDAWVKAGKPAAFSKLPTVSYPVKPEGATKLRGMIRKAADFNKTRARFGEDIVITPELARDTAGLNEAHVGLVLVTFGIMDKSEKSEKPATEKPAEKK
jgi:hypothetical protein